MKVYYDDNKNVPSGHICNCGEKHKWSVYVYAHMTDKLIFKCPTCGCKVQIYKGKVKEEK